MSLQTFLERAQIGTRRRALGRPLLALACALATSCTLKRDVDSYAQAEDAATASDTSALEAADADDGVDEPDALADADDSTSIGCEPSCDDEPPDAAGDTAVDAAVAATPERHACDVNAERGWVDVGRKVARNLDGTACALVSMGDDWNPLRQSPPSDAEGLSRLNETDAKRYIQRAIEKQADVIGLLVSYVAGALIVHYDAAKIPRAEEWPSLASVLGLAELGVAEQPLQLVLSALGEDAEAAAGALLAVISEATLVRRCRPIHLVASDTWSFQALDILRQRLFASDAYAAIRQFVYFGYRLNAQGARLVEDMRYMQARGFEVAHFDARRAGLLRAITQAQQLGLLVHVYYVGSPWMGAALCGLVDAVAWSLQLDRIPEAEVIDDVRRPVSGSRVFLELDTRAAEAGAAEVMYGVYPPRQTLTAALISSSPQLAPETEPLAGVALLFERARRLSLALGDLEHPLFSSQTPPRATPFSLIVAGRLGSSDVAAGERQVILSKLHEQSGWSLELVHEDAGQMLSFQTFGLGTDGNVRRARVALPVDALPLDRAFLFHVQVHFSAIHAWLGDREMGQNFASDSYFEHAQIDNDATLTLGADPGGEESFFEGDLQLVRAVVYP